MVHFGRRFVVPEVADRVEARRLDRAGAAQRHGGEIGQVLHDTLGILDREEIIVAALGIHPEAGRDRALSTRKNRSKTRGRASGGIPIPLSATSRIAWLSR